ncbi:hypothetical protein EON65_42245 [archaeon]|nr:MAG: hypothetical protein EON65_42245 [archaeon]
MENSSEKYGRELFVASRATHPKPEFCKTRVLLPRSNRTPKSQVIIRASHLEKSQSTLREGGAMMTSAAIIDENKHENIIRLSLAAQSIM